MITIPKKKIEILIIGSIALELVFTSLAFWLNKVLTDYYQVPFGNLLLWEIFAAYFSLYALVRPWRWKKKFKSISAKQQMTSKRENSFLAMFCYLSFIVPVIYGMVLIFWGIPFSEYLYFAGASVLDTLVWGVYTLKTNYEDTPKLSE